MAERLFADARFALPGRVGGLGGRRAGPVASERFGEAADAAGRFMFDHPSSVASVALDGTPAAPPADPRLPSEP